MVLEARDRVGGRTLNQDIGQGKVVEMGGQWVGPIDGPVVQSGVLALARDLGVDTFKTYDDGDTLDYRHGVLSPYSALPPATVAGFLEALSAIGTLDGLAQSVPLDAPWTAPNADALDASTIELAGGTRLARRRTRSGARRWACTRGPRRSRFLDLLASIRTRAAASSSKSTPKVGRRTPLRRRLRCYHGIASQLSTAFACTRAGHVIRTGAV